MKPSKSFLIKTIKHQISIIKENLAMGLKSLKSYILDLIDLEEKVGYVDLVTLKYHGESVKSLCDMVREALATLGVS